MSPCLYRETLASRGRVALSVAASGERSWSAWPSKYLKGGEGKRFGDLGSRCLSSRRITPASTRPPPRLSISRRNPPEMLSSLPFCHTLPRPSSSPTALERPRLRREREREKIPHRRCPVAARYNDDYGHHRDSFHNPALES